ncbi:hypothetical protein Y032_0326g2566 [Ancylostoma ceylanicum]|uniref:Uncharacterized protein n=1 Tax=Ancylostoma ceylanicum TaxID=53326 RepID=A0A016S003_9BILA|nr:hypothetical protein Y032_0326g2566 [Ancylostoma ceylanicum]
MDAQGKRVDARINDEYVYVVLTHLPWVISIIDAAPLTASWLLTSAIINPKVPRTHGNTLIHQSRIDSFVEVDREIYGNPEGMHITEVWLSFFSFVLTHFYIINDWKKKSRRKIGWGLAIY